MSSPRGAMEQCLVLVCLLLATVSASPPQCCPQGQSYVDDSKNCTDGRGIRLNCAGGFYMHGLQPEVGEEPYTFTLDANNSTWVQFNGSTGFKIPPDEYCLASRTTGGREVMLICFVEETKDPRILIFGTLSLVSSVFLAVTLFVYLALPELREVQDRAMTCMTVSFMVAFFFTGIQQLNESTLKEEFTCVFVAFVMYYAYMSAFCWLNVISLNIWRCVWYPSLRVKTEVLLAIYSLVGWGLPLCFLGLSLFGHNDKDRYFIKPGFGENNCWFNNKTSTWTYFYGPIMVLLLMNLLYLALTACKLWHEYRDLSSCKLNVLKAKCIMCIKLALIMGVTWIFEIVSFIFGDINRYYWILPDIVNVLQGFLMFMVLVVCRNRVRKLLAQRRPLGIPFPKSWAAYDDTEDCEAANPEELQLSQSS